jgi:uncharacterized alpha-E superfamily protein
MLSRVAERIYWIARYIERAENSARLVNAYTHQMLDLPSGVEPGWRQLVDIIGDAPAFDEHYLSYDEHNTVSFLVADDFSPSSIFTSVSMARENMRTTRELLPTEAWHHCNELYLQVRNHAHEGIPRRGRHAFLKDVIFRCQQLTGLLAGTMSHDTAYDLVRLGRNLERADMTTRIIDSAIFILMPRHREPGQYDNLLWINVLKSSSGDQMYRQHVRSRVEGAAVVKFLLQDRYFPRSVARAVAEAEFSIHHLPRNKAPLLRILELRERLLMAAVDDMSLEDMHAFIDKLQLALNLVHNEIFRTWFQIHHPAPRLRTTGLAHA